MKRILRVLVSKLEPVPGRGNLQKGEEAQIGAVSPPRPEVFPITWTTLARYDAAHGSELENILAQGMLARYIELAAIERR